MDGANKTARCDCGYTACAADDDELIAAVQKHAHEAHGIAFTREEAVLVVRKAAMGLPPKEREGA
jgi:predicted small metal-binding protein